MYRVWACDNAHTTNLSAEHIDSRVCHYPLIMLLAYLSIQASWQPTRLHKWPQINLRGLQSAYLYFNSGHKPNWHWNPSSLCTESTNYDTDYKQSTWNVSTHNHPWRKIKGTLHIFPLSGWADSSSKLGVAELCSRDTCLAPNIREVHEAPLVVLKEPKNSTALIPEVTTQFLKITNRPWFTSRLFPFDVNFQFNFKFQVWTPLTLTSCPVLRTHPLFTSVWQPPSVPLRNCSQVSDSEDGSYYRRFLTRRKRWRRSVFFKITSWCWLLLFQPQLIPEHSF